ncbi:MAG TPA: tRNA preQ1(34) S-adenosylmethionine ribosyltransferase-isomerase QueA [Polyangiaceae bacterium]|nr:tRNA preQ1(34) S-adenosylmethionine ribosyltransferase-isomerase QueA [Polyangiaceae bacterium]
MRVDLLKYDLPPERVAQFPSEDREQARLMVLAGAQAPDHRRVSELADLLPPGSLVVLNDTRVVPARLIAQKETGGRVEVFLVRHVGSRTIEVHGEPRDAQIWRALGKASKALRFGIDMRVVPNSARNVPSTAGLHVRLLGRSDEDGLLEVALYTSGRVPVAEAIRTFGRMPLPPYIKRDAEPEDADRYQTVFARVDGAIAAPTAGLHLSHGLLGRLAVHGLEVVSVTLHVGLGTFQPVVVEDLDQHKMHREQFEVSRTTAQAIERARARGSKVVAVGTTVVRALESAVDASGTVRAMSGDTSLLIQPGHRFQAVDWLLTNFHLPRSTLLALVCAFGGTERVLGAYRTAVDASYRFYSYGDAMLIERGPQA